MEAIIAKHREPVPGAAPVAYHELHAAAFWQQLSVLLRRNFTAYNRSPGEAALCVGLELRMGVGMRVAGAYHSGSQTLQSTT